MYIIALSGNKWFFGEVDEFSPKPINGKYEIELNNAFELVNPTNIRKTENGGIEIDKANFLLPITYAFNAIPKIYILADACFSTKGLEEEVLAKLLKNTEDAADLGKAVRAGLVLPR